MNATPHIFLKKINSPSLNYLKFITPKIWVLHTWPSVAPATALAAYSLRTSSLLCSTPILFLLSLAQTAVVARGCRAITGAVNLRAAIPAQRPCLPPIRLSTLSATSSSAQDVNRRLGSGQGEALLGNSSSATRHGRRLPACVVGAPPSPISSLFRLRLSTLNARSRCPPRFALPWPARATLPMSRTTAPPLTPVRPLCSPFDPIF
jgi:hypothetical protein